MKLDEPSLSDDIEIRRKTPNDTALHLAINVTFADDASHRAALVAFSELIATHIADINTPGAVGLPPLHLAAHLRSVDFARLLVDQGADVNAITVHPDESKLSPLHFASMNGDSSLVDLFIAHGADVNAEASIRNTPLHMAAAYGVGADILASLIKAGARVDAQDLEGYTALHLSVYAVASAPAAALAQVLELAKHCNAECAGLKTKIGLTALQIAEDHKLVIDDKLIAALKGMSSAEDLKSEL
jgi:ankyrin repeat protein